MSKRTKPKKGKVVLIALLLIMGIGIAINAANQELSATDGEEQQPQQKVSTVNDGLSTIFEKYSAGKTMTIATLEKDLSELLDKEIEGDIVVSESSNYAGQYLATYDVYDLPKGTVKLKEAQELARNVVYYINAARERYNLPILYSSFSIMEVDSSRQLIVTGLGSKSIEKAPDGAWSNKPMETKDFIQYVQSNYNLGVTSSGKTDYTKRVFYRDADWIR